MPNRGYKKYMKKNAEKEYPLLRLFLLSFFGMLLFCTFMIKMIFKPVDVSIGDYQHDQEISEEYSNIDGRLNAIQDEDQGRNFSDLMKEAADVKQDKLYNDVRTDTISVSEAMQTPAQDPLYKVFIGSYTSAEQAKVAKDIINDTDANLNPIVKCIGSNNYTLQVGIFKNKGSAEALLSTIKQNHLPGRIVQEY